MSGSLLGNGFGAADESGYEEIEIDMAALLSILSKLLFFLLTSFGLGFMSVVAANVPTVTEDNTVFLVSKAKVTATISITKEGMSVTASNEMLTEAEQNALKRKFPITKEGYDFKRLHEYMYQLKQKYGESDTVVITPDPEISYEILVNVMDASRERVVIVEGRPIKYPLFPAVVISTLVK